MLRIIIGVPHLGITIRKSGLLPISSNVRFTYEITCLVIFVLCLDKTSVCLSGISAFIEVGGCEFMLIPIISVKDLCIAVSAVGYLLINTYICLADEVAGFIIRIIYAKDP